VVCNYSNDNTATKTLYDEISCINIKVFFDRILVFQNHQVRFRVSYDFKKVILKNLIMVKAFN